MTFKIEQLSDNVTIYCGDSREIIPLVGKVDAVVSDPPYGIEDLVEGYGRSHRNIANDKNLNCVIEVLNLIKQTQNNIWLATFFSSRISPLFFQSTSMLDYFGEIIWDKKNIGLGTQIRYQHENIAFFKIGEPPPLNDVGSVLTYTVLKGEARSIHPHEKPTQVLNNLCAVVPGKIILDPFMGTGTTGAGAVQQKRGFIGIELNPAYFDLARKKISAALAQPTAFWE